MLLSEYGSKPDTASALSRRVSENEEPNEGRMIRRNRCVHCTRSPENAGEIA